MTYDSEATRQRMTEDFAKASELYDEWVKLADEHDDRLTRGSPFKTPLPTLAGCPIPARWRELRSGRLGASRSKSFERWFGSYTTTARTCGAIRGSQHLDSP